MKKVAISCDSVHVTPEKAKEYGLILAPFSIMVGSRRYSDTEIDLDELYGTLENKDNLPTTSMPSVGEFIELFINLSQEADAILHINITSVFSASYQNALKARETANSKLPNTRIEVVDSRTTGMGVCLTAREALSSAADGKSLDEVLQYVNLIIPRVNDFSARDTLFYLDKGGRIFEAKSWSKAEKEASFRSIIEIDASSEGTVRPVARAKTEAQIIDQLVELSRQRASAAKTLRGDIGYSRGAEERAVKLKEALITELRFDRLDTAEISAAVAVHNGRGFLDYAFCPSLD
jgi:DegV family protein with EDD domain